MAFYCTDTIQKSASLLWWGRASPVTVDESLGRSLGIGSGAKSEPIRIEEQAEDNKIMTRH